jgi:hypothetical protein
MKILNIQILKAYILYYALLLSIKVEFSSQLLVEVVQWLICMISNIVRRDTHKHNVEAGISVGN